MRLEIKERLDKFDIKNQLLFPSEGFVELLQSMTKSEIESVFGGVDAL